jgi:hypothetical protein
MIRENPITTGQAFGRDSNDAKAPPEVIYSLSPGSQIKYRKAVKFLVFGTPVNAVEEFWKKFKCTSN